jgi:hypothetical protein
MSGDCLLPVPHLILLALYQRGIGVKRSLDLLGAPRAQKNAALRMLKGAIELTPEIRRVRGEGSRIGSDKLAQRIAQAKAREAALQSQRMEKQAKVEAAKAAGISLQMLRYYANHEESKAQRRVRAKERYERLKNEPHFIMRQAARNCVSRIARQIKTHRRKVRSRTVEFLGCNYEAAAAWISAQFRDGMTWENHGEVWEIDHKRPLASFDLKVEDQRRQAMHYTNLQPLLVHENRAKSDKWESAA